MEESILLNASIPIIATTKAVPEPGPDWQVAKKIWGAAWGMHWIGFGVLFGLLAVHSFMALVFVNRRKGFCRKPLFIAINSMLFVLGVTRALYLLLDPYESRQNGVKDPEWMTLLLFGIAYPCLSSSFCLIHLAFLEVTYLKIGPSKLQNVKFISTIIAVHFVVVFTAESVTSIKPELKVLLIVCQSFFILWGLLLSGSFIYSGWKVISYVERVQQQLRSIEKNGNLRNSPKQKSRTTKVARVTLVTSLLGAVVCFMQCYNMISLYALYSNITNPEPWSWLAFQSCFRLVELAMACTIAYSVMQPRERENVSRRHPLTARNKATTL